MDGSDVSDPYREPLSVPGSLPLSKINFEHLACPQIDRP